MSTMLPKYTGIGSVVPADRLRHGLQWARLAHGTTLKRREYWLSLAFTMVGLASSAYLSLVSLGMTEVVGCGGGKLNCNSVLSSDWSKWMGIPVSMLALGLYTVLFTTLVSLPFVKSAWAKSRLQAIWVLLGSMASAAAIWFISLQVMVLGQFCTWCLVAHSAGLLLAAVVLFGMPSRPISPAPLAGMAALGVTVLAGGQLMSPKAPTYKIEVPIVNQSPSAEIDQFEAPGAESAPQEQSKKIEKSEPARSGAGLMSIISPFRSSSLHMLWVGAEPKGRTARATQQENGEAKNEKQDEKRQVIFSSPVSGKRTSLTVGDWPHIGNPESDHQFIELVDYTCPHCRAMHKVLTDACLSAGAGEAAVGVTVLIVPMNSRCNPSVAQDSPVHQNACDIAALALSVWRADPAKFAEFHQWLMQGEQAPDTGSAQQEAARLVGEEELQKQLNDAIVGQYLEKNAQLYSLAGAGTIPKILFQEKAVVGRLQSPDEFRHILQIEFPNLSR